MYTITTNLIKELKKKHSLTNFAKMVAHMESLVSIPQIKFNKKLAEILGTIYIAAELYEAKMYKGSYNDLKYFTLMEKLLFKIEFGSILKYYNESESQKTNILMLITSLIKIVSHYNASCVKIFEEMTSIVYDNYDTTVWMASRCRKYNIYTKLQEIKIMFADKNNNPYSHLFYIDVKSSASAVTVSKRTFKELPPIYSLSERYKNISRQISEREDLVLPIAMKQMNVSSIMKCKSAVKLLQLIKETSSKVHQSNNLNKNQMDYLLLLIAATLEKLTLFENECPNNGKVLRRSNIKTKTPAIMKEIKKLIESLSVFDIFYKLDDTIVKDHLLDISYLLDTNYSLAEYGLHASIAKFRYLRLRFNGHQSMTRINLNDSRELIHQGEQCSTVITANIIDEKSLHKWSEKFCKHPNLESAMTVYREHCVACEITLAKAPDVAIFCECDHVTCLECTKSWFEASTEQR